jgi:hypothetical protein
MYHSMIQSIDHLSFNDIIIEWWMLKAPTQGLPLRLTFYNERSFKKGHFGPRPKWHNPYHPPNPRGKWGQLSLEALARKAIFYHNGLRVKSNGAPSRDRIKRHHITPHTVPSSDVRRVVYADTTRVVYAGERELRRLSKRYTSSINRRGPGEAPRKFDSRVKQSENFLRLVRLSERPPQSPHKT